MELAVPILGGLCTASKKKSQAANAPDFDVRRAYFSLCRYRNLQPALHIVLASPRRFLYLIRHDTLGNIAG